MNEPRMLGVKALLGALAAVVTATPALAAPVTFRIDPGACSTGPVSGRLLLFAKAATGALPERVDAGSFDARETAVAAQEVRGAISGGPVTVDADVLSFPQAFSTLPPGRYAVQAVLDPDHSYAYSGRGPGDCVSPVVAVDLPMTGDSPSLTLGAPTASRDPWMPNPRASAEQKQGYVDAKPFIRELAFTSPALSRFWGRPTQVTGWVVLPPGYDERSSTRYPVVYETHGFGGSHGSQLDSGIGVWREMKGGQSPPMIWVMLDEGFPTGTHEFADSVNNGPWGEALTAELIPDLERRYRMDAKPNGRFLQGHSSGGWAALWLQVRYPALFGGSWPTSPDPSDFHNATNADLYAPNGNVYRQPNGSKTVLIRAGGKDMATYEDFAKLEAVTGEFGGQESSFDWVFSPKGADGRPMPLYDRATGVVDPMVAAYWRDHYDIAERYRRHWPELKRDLDGKVHLTVGTADTFFLDRSARLLEATMKGLGAKTDFRYVEGRSHFDLYAIGADRQGLRKQIAWEMYAIARPGSKRPAEVAAPKP